jgi:hypothetical protein
MRRTWTHLPVRAINSICCQLIQLQFQFGEGLYKCEELLRPLDLRQLWWHQATEPIAYLIMLCGEVHPQRWCVHDRCEQHDS